ncbi:MAG: prolyl oligopeptidase family serine peptidase [Bacteroidales bacterium]|nr:prolyl oligopeptidase family serine peptidase [Bacteroidales bacterium]
MYNFFLISIIFLVLTIKGYSQKTFEIPKVYYEWNQIKNANISSGGKIIAYEKNKLKGDGSLHIHIPSKNIHDSISKAEQTKISYNESFVAFKINPSYDTLRKLKLNDISKKKYPKDSLGIYVINNRKILKIARVKSFKIPEKSGNWIAYLHKKEKKEKSQNQEADTLSTDTSETDTVKKTIGHRLVLYNPLTNDELTFIQVKNYKFSENGKRLIISKETKQDDTDKNEVEVIVVDLTSFTVEQVFSGKGKIADIAVGPDGEHYAFIYTGDTTEIKDYHLYMDNQKIADSATSFLFENWQISSNSNLYFSEEGKRLFFETAPKPKKKAEDTLTDDEKYHVDIWHWRDRRLQPQQKKQKKRDIKRDYKAFYDIKKEKFLQVETKKLRHVYILKGNTSDYAFALDSKPYKRETSWTGRRFRDVYYINLKKNQCRCILKKHDNRISFSPAGRYVLYYSEKDSSWYSIDLKKDKKINLTGKLDVPFYNIKHDMPVEVKAYGVAGWDKNQHAYIYDRYDIWKIDASGKQSPVNVTKSHGRNTKTRFRYKKTDPEAYYLPDTLLLSLFQYSTKDAGYAQCLIKNSGKPEVLIKGAFKNYGIKKARESNDIIFRKGNFRNYPELYLTTSAFDTIQKLSATNPQQKNYRWGSVELTNWISNNGDSLSGLVYKPEKFDPEKKHPMIVYFYERYSDQLHTHYIPKPSHSVINFTRYLNDGYVIFIPDIIYKTGYPGKSAEDAVLSGTLHMIDKGFIDHDRIGIQGQSWGGYQVAHLVTRTDLYSAAMAGAPVSNMTSAYGGIRWGSGMSRAFQYEQTQSRIGGTLWEKPLHYIENSPLFYAPDVNTPVLMMHNDHDGAVPWYQGIEFFNALRRLNKPAYLLVYNNDKHNLRHWGNRIDLSIRMKQFFDHYLKSSPMPVWMKYGIPAIDKGKKTGYKLTD